MHPEDATTAFRQERLMSYGIFDVDNNDLEIH